MKKRILIILMLAGLLVCGGCIWVLTREEIFLAVGFSLTFVQAMRPIALISLLVAVLSLIALMKPSKTDLPI